MERYQARPVPRRSLPRQMARPMREPAPATRWPATRADVARQGRRARLRRWVGPVILIAPAVAGLLSFAGIGSSAQTSPTSTQMQAGGGHSAAATQPPTTVRRTPAPTALPALDGASTPDSPPVRTSAPAALARPTVTPPAPGLVDFDAGGPVIAISFPLAADAGYRYRDNYGDARPGTVEHYNHAAGERGGRLRRAHDGIDIYAPRGTPVLAPFDGVVVDPAKRWQPWRDTRYGLTVVIVSDEPTSAGYAAVLAHLDVCVVRAGEAVRRGQPVGTVGITGNAEGSDAQLHFELRAPRALPWTEAGRPRLVDAFNPYQSLRAADPARGN